MNDPTDLLGGALTPPVTDICPRCGGQGLEPCNACMDTGIGGDGGDCRECSVPGTPCAACSSDVCPSCGLDDDHTPSCDRKPRIEAPELPEDAGELDELWQHLGDAIRALGALTPEHIDAMADELNYGELADLFLDAKAMADTIKAVEGRAKDLLLTEARRRFDEDGTATKWKRDRGTVSLAVPDTPKPYVRDAGALIAWLEAYGMDTLVDRDPRPDPKALDALAKSGTVTDTGIFVADGDGTPVDGVGCRPPGSPYLSRRSS